MPLVLLAIVAIGACKSHDWDLFDVKAYCDRVIALYQSGACNGVANPTCTGASWNQVVPPSCNAAIGTTSCADLVDRSSPFWKACEPSNGCKAAADPSYTARVCSAGAVVTDCSSTVSFDCRKICEDKHEDFNDDCDDSCGCCGATPPTGFVGRAPVTDLCCCQ